jgi:phage gp16-like protein
MRAHSFLSKDSPERRRAELAKIHCQAKQLGIEGEYYRNLVRRMTGKDSAGDLDGWQRGALLDELRRLGARSPKTGDADQRPGEPQERLVFALWRDLGELGVLKDPSEKGLRAFVRKQTGVAALEWLDVSGLNQIVEALKAWRLREMAKQSLAK